MERRKKNPKMEKLLKQVNHGYYLNPENLVILQLFVCKIWLLAENMIRTSLLRYVQKMSVPIIQVPEKIEFSCQKDLEEEPKPILSDFQT